MVTRLVRALSSKTSRRLGRARVGRASVATLALVALAIGAAGCGDDDSGDTTPSGTSTTSSGASGSITVGGADFTEMLIMEQIYALALKDAGFTVNVLSVTNRENYASALESGEIDVVPEYAATMAEFLNVEDNGPDATPVASGDVNPTVSALKKLAEAHGLAVLDVSQAADENAFMVTKAFADENGLETLSDLAALDQPIKLAAAQECPERPFCEPGLESTYGLNITEVLPLGYGSLQTKQAVQNGEAQLGQTGTTDGSLDQFDLVVLKDDQQLQNADNLIPMVNADTLAEHPEIADVLNAVSAALTTEILGQMNLKVDVERQQPEDVARDFLESAGLIG
jgi:osmoprotectant transport system substrate-binding protein